jgi:hypothetical protein
MARRAHRLRHISANWGCGQRGGARTGAYRPGFMARSGVLKLASAAMLLNMGESNMAQGNQALGL